jgi:hypothetical protein
VSTTKGERIALCKAIENAECGAVMYDVLQAGIKDSDEISFKLGLVPLVNGAALLTAVLRISSSEAPAPLAIMVLSLFGAVVMAESASAEVVVLLALGPWLIDRIGVRGAAMISGTSGVVRWGTVGLTANASVMALVEPLHGFTFALLHLVCMQVLGDIVPRRLAATAQNVYGTVIVGGAVTIMTFISGPLYQHFGAKAFWLMAGLCAAAIPLCAKLKVARSPSRLSWLVRKGGGIG